jgi:hypothetical protein
MVTARQAILLNMVSGCAVLRQLPLPMVAAYLRIPLSSVYMCQLVRVELLAASIIWNILELVLSVQIVRVLAAAARVWSWRHVPITTVLRSVLIFLRVLESRAPGSGITALATLLLPIPVLLPVLVLIVLSVHHNNLCF